MNKSILHRINTCLAALLMLSACVLLVGQSAQAAGNISDIGVPELGVHDFTSGKYVVVVRDITPSADCHWQVNGTSLPCLPGSVIGDFVVPREEAIASGEEYVVYTGDYATDEAAISKLMAKVGARYAERTKSTAGPMIATACGCNNRCTAGGSYTASNFPGSPSPVVGYSTTYDVGYYNGTCNAVSVISESTWLVSAGQSATYLEFTSFRPTPGDPSYGYNAGCASLPHSGTYPTPMNGFTGYYFTNQVQSDCWFFPRHAYGYVPLN